MTSSGAVVLAGGRSERMGQDKALLRLPDGRTLLETVVETVRPLVGRVIVVAAEAEQYALRECRVIGDATPQMGPVGGILAGLREFGAGRHLVVACDMPTLQPDLLRMLLERAEGEWDAVVPEIDGRLEPLCAVYRDTALAPLERFLASGGRAVHQALGQMRTLRLPESELRRFDPDLRTFTNLNTLPDFQRLQRSDTNRP